MGVNTSRPGEFLPTSVKTARIVTWTRGRPSKSVTDPVAVEEPLEIRLETRPFVTTLRTPGHDEELAAGFLLSEGIVRLPTDILEIRPYSRNRWGNVLDVFLAAGLEPDIRRTIRRGAISSSCGLCGKESLGTIRTRFKPIPPGPVVASSLLTSLPGVLREAQAGFAATGGLHAVGLFDLDGTLLVAREDVGRHNALDKVLGHALLKGWLPMNRHLLLLSGRASFEMMQKAVAGGVPIVAAVSAPSSLAIQLARSSRQTLVGFLRDERFNVYTGHGRVRALL